MNVDDIIELVPNYLDKPIDVNRIVGKSFQEAEDYLTKQNKGCSLRLIKEDDKSFSYSSKPTALRINVEIQRNRIVKAVYDCDWRFSDNKSPPFNEQSLVGLTIKDATCLAQDNGKYPEILWIDGELVEENADFCSYKDRLLFSVVSGWVTEVRQG